MGKKADKKVTQKMLREFWKHNIHPITGLIQNTKWGKGNVIETKSPTIETEIKINNKLNY